MTDTEIKSVLTEIHTNQKWLIHEMRDLKKITTKYGERLDSLESEVYTRKAIIKLLRWLGAGAILVLTFKFGDISDWWSRL